MIKCFLLTCPDFLFFLLSQSHKINYLRGGLNYFGDFQKQFHFFLWWSLQRAHVTECIITLGFGNVVHDAKKLSQRFRSGH